MSKQQLRSLTEEQVAQFKLNGFLTVENVLSTEEVETIAAHSDFIAAGKAENIPSTSIQIEPAVRDSGKPIDNQVLSVRKLFNLAVYDDIMWSHVTNPRIVDIIADLLGTDDIKMYADQFFMKSPKGVGSAQQWHQDSASWRDIFPMDLVSAWAALDHATEENGCLNFLPGTHRWGMVRGDRLKVFLGRPGRGAVAHRAGAAHARQRQFPPQSYAAHEQRQPIGQTTPRLRHTLHARQLVEG